MGGASTDETRARRERSDRLRAIRDAYFARGACCHYCGVVPSLTGRGADLPSLDHSLPTTRGGGDEDANLVYCCRGCNSAKNDRTVPEAYLHLRLRRLGWPRFSEEQIAWLRGRGFDLSELDAMKLFFEDPSPPSSPR